MIKGNDFAHPQQFISDRTDDKPNNTGFAEEFIEILTVSNVSFSSRFKKKAKQGKSCRNISPESHKVLKNKLKEKHS